MKQCSKCLAYKPTFAFYKKPDAKDGLRSYCIPCNKVESKIWTQNNKEQYRKNASNYLKNNVEKVYLKNQKRRKLIYENLQFDIKPSFVKKLYESPCVVCGSKNQIEMDHIIPVSRGGTNSEGNLQPLCKKCNLSKGSKTMTEWLLG
jgi:5-methylcytosine-specific restriction endonuclease McrA